MNWSIKYELSFNRIQKFRKLTDSIGRLDLLECVIILVLFDTQVSIHIRFRDVFVAALEICCFEKTGWNLFFFHVHRNLNLAACNHLSTLSNLKFSRIFDDVYGEFDGACMKCKVKVYFGVSWFLILNIANKKLYHHLEYMFLRWKTYSQSQVESLTWVCSGNDSLFSIPNTSKKLHNICE